LTSGYKRGELNLLCCIIDLVAAPQTGAIKMEKQETKESKPEERKSKTATKGFAIPCDTFNPNDRSLAEGAD